MKSKLSEKLGMILETYETYECLGKIDETKLIKPDILPVIQDLTENSWATGKKRMVEACRKLIKISESNEPIAKAYMRSLDKATTKIGNFMVEKLNNGGFKGKEVL